MASKAIVAPVAFSAAEVVGEGVGAGVDDVLGAFAVEEVDVLLATHEVDEWDAVGEADPIEHQAEVGGADGVDEGGVALHAHRLDHAEGGQRVDEGCRRLLSGDALPHRDAALVVEGSVLRVAVAGDEPDDLAEQGLRVR